jgi:hypothetical protein
MRVLCVVLCKINWKKKEKRRNGRGEEEGYLSSYNLNITDGFPNRN